MTHADAATTDVETHDAQRDPQRDQRDLRRSSALRMRCEFRSYTKRILLQQRRNARRMRHGTGLSTDTFAEQG